METRASYVLIGTFVLLAILAGFGFVYWLHNAGGLGQRTAFGVRFPEPVGGLTTGSTVLFNGIRVGEVLGLRIEPDRPNGLYASISVDASTPIRTDTIVDIDYQGLTGVAAIALRGVSADAPAVTAADGQPPVLTAGKGVGQTLTQAAKVALQRVDDVVSENRESLKTAISGISTFADMLGRNSERIEGVLGGLEKMTGGGGPKEAPKVYDLDAPTQFPTFEKSLDAQVSVPDPNALLVFDSQRVLTKAPDDTFANVENAQWADNLPKLLQARIVQSFSNAKQLRMVSRPMDDLNADYKLAIEIRSFQIALGKEPVAEVNFTARILGSDGKVVAAQDFKAQEPAKSAQVGDAIPALNAAFGRAATELVKWTVGTL